MNCCRHLLECIGRVLLLALVLSPAHIVTAQLVPESEEPSKWLRWEPASTEFIIGQRGPSIVIGGEVMEDDTELLKNLAFLWNHVGANVQYDIVSGCVDGDGFPCGSVGDPRGNGKNEIHFKSPVLSGLNDPLGRVFFVDDFFSSCTPLPSGICVDGRITEADVFLNRLEVFFTWRDLGACEPGAATDFVESVLLHEMGHALGLRHINESGPHIMHPGFGCQAFPAPGRPLGLTEKDKKQLRALYGPFDQVQVAITSPPGNNSPIFPGQMLNLLASTSGTASTPTSGPAPQSGHTLHWTSGDVELGVGEDLSVPTELILPGSQEIVAEALDAQGNRLGSDSVSVQMITDIVTTDKNIFHPIPCVERVDDPDGKCLLIIREDWTAGSCQAGIFDSVATLQDLDSNQSFPVSKAGLYFSPFGLGCEDFQAFPLFHYAWPWSSFSPVHLRFQHTVFRNGQFHAQNNVTGAVHRVQPVLNRLDFPLACHREAGANSCELEVSWNGLYFAPSAGLYSRNPGQSEWGKRFDVGVATGTVAVEADGSQAYQEFAIFQYGSDVRIPDSDWPSHADYRTVISAPAGQVASQIRTRTVGPIDAGASPVSGSWGNSDRSGNGLFISRNSSNQYLLIWLTYDEGGDPIWYLSDAVPVSGGVLESPLFQAKFDHTNSQVTIQELGAVRLSLASDTEGVFAWTLEESAGPGASGAERMEFFHGGAQQTGLWSSSDPRWSLAASVAGEGSQAVGIANSLFYNAGGDPVWGQAVFFGNPGAGHTLGVDFFDGQGLCPGCIGMPMDLDWQDIGLVGVSLGPTPVGWIDVQVPGEGGFVVGSSGSPVPLNRITLQAQLLDDR